MQDQSQLLFAPAGPVAQLTGDAKLPQMSSDSPAEPKRKIGPSRRKLIAAIREFLAETEMRPTPFGLLAAQDDKLLWRIENAPKGISLDKADKIYAFMEDARRSSDYLKKVVPRAYGRTRHRKQKASAE